MHNSKTGNLLLVSNYPSGTAYAWWLMEHFWISIAGYFTTQGHKVYLAYPQITTVSKTITNAPIEIIELTIPWTTSTQSSHVRHFIRKKNITFIYFTDQPYFNLKYAIMRYYGVRYIIVHDHTPGDRPPIGGLKGAIKTARNILPWMSADKVLCVSPLMRKRNITNVHIPEHKCLVVQNGIPPVNCYQNKRASIRDKIGVKNTSLVVTTTGRAHPYKRFDFIIECAKQLKIQLPECNITFLLVGDGPAMPELRKQISRHSLQENVLLLGYRSDVQNILCASDIALHAALGEGFSLSIIEYMSAGLAVLVPDIPSVSQAITHNKTGIIYKWDEPESVVSYIKELANDNKRIYDLGIAAKTKADNIYNLKQCTQTLIRIIKNIYLQDL